MRGQRHDYAYYAKRAGGSAVGDVPVAAVWQQLMNLGGENGYYYLDWLWRTREIISAATGTGGLRRTRRQNADLHIGDYVDTWEVIGVEREKRLTLRMHRGAPGAGVLEVEADALSSTRTRLTATAYWHPAGVRGLLYWYSLIPAHLVIFDGLTRTILERAAGALPHVPRDDATSGIHRGRHHEAPRGDRVARVLRDDTRIRDFCRGAHRRAVTRPRPVRQCPPAS